MKHAGLAFVDLVSGNVVMPGAHLIMAHVRNLHQFHDGLKVGREMLLATLAFMEMQERQINNMLAFWEPILEDLETQAERRDKDPKNN